MRHDPISPNKRKSVNLSIDTGIVAAAREAGVNLSRVTEAALRVAVKDAREQRWREENREAIERFTNWYEDQGDPLAHLASL
ncbi:antitoxin CcdA [Sphingomonas insulae]|uniref:Post-segregation antitoxin CcdA n=1 Tax=Sphingomonas insulae TaxID=424800 RepID=A0ABN1HLN4_9SPHN|nr:type II toxin-antitoxin system CcdA family antitoxin [Sphingomonas insulae]NIJ30208.1 antitoxin CcdA [Sphingomonas insulae]